MAGLLSEAAQSGEFGILPAFSPECLTTAEYFLDLILLPIVMRALSGENLETLHAGSAPMSSKESPSFLRRAGMAVSAKCSGQTGFRGSRKGNSV